MNEQIILSWQNNYLELDEYLESKSIKSIFLVCQKYIDNLEIGKYFNSLRSRKGIKVFRFSDFSPNPVYESVVKGVRCFKENGCDIIIAVGGGSSIDVAKCIKLYANMNLEQNFLKQKVVSNDIKLVAIPTTAGTGSEATKYAVIYHKDEKQSITHDSCLPGIVLMDPNTLVTLSEYQRKVTMLDALCHGIESFWSINSTSESKKYSIQAIKQIIMNKDKYLNNEFEGNKNMLLASNLSGKAINITQTTAGHAMCYKLTSLYGIAHGHAAALCVEKLWEYMINNISDCTDIRGEEYLRNTFNELESYIAHSEFKELLCDLKIDAPRVRKEMEYEVLKQSVNTTRLANNPIKLNENVIDSLYHSILADRRKR